MACSQTIVLFKPKPNIDPMPKTAACAPPAPDTDDPLFKDQWALTQLGLSQEALKSSLVQGNANVRIAVLSTGVDYNHEDLCGQISTNSRELVEKAPGDRADVMNREDDDGNGLVDDVVGYDVVDGDGFAFDRHGAGTAVAGIIGANQRNGIGIAGLMKQVTMVPIRFIDNNGQTSIGNLASALNAALILKPHVVFLQTAQLQLGGHGQDSGQISDELGLVKGYFNRLRDAKIPVVVGAGDDMSTFGSTEMDKLLRSYDNVFVVTAVDKDGRRTLLANVHTQDVVTAAPGEAVISLKPGNQYGEVNGTAYAAAHLTAALGLARAQLAERMDAVKIANILVSSKGSEADQGLERDTRGGTRLQLVKFLTEVKSL